MDSESSRGDCKTMMIVQLEIQKCMHSAQFVRFEVFTAVTVKNAVFWDVTPCGSCKNRRFRGT
jgi:hypothetical protein